jgi:hypothetical protein
MPIDILKIFEYLMALIALVIIDLFILKKTSKTYMFF